MSEDAELRSDTVFVLVLDKKEAMIKDKETTHTLRIAALTQDKRC